MEEVVIVAALRTAVGKFGGSLAKVPAADLGAQVIKALLASSGISPDQVSEVLMGQVLTAGCGQNPARQAALRGGSARYGACHDGRQGLRKRIKGDASGGAGHSMR